MSYLRLANQIRRGPARGLTKWELCQRTGISWSDFAGVMGCDRDPSGAHTARAWLRTEHGLLVPRPLPPTWRYRAVAFDQLAIAESEEACIADMIGRTESAMVRAAEMVCQAVLHADRAAERFWEAQLSDEGHRLVQLNRRYDAIHTYVPAGGRPAPSRLRARRRARLIA